MGFRITYDIQDGQYIFHTKDGYLRFNKDEIVLSYIYSNTPQDMAFLQTVQENFEGFTKKEVAAAKLAREAQWMIGRPY